MYPPALHKIATQIVDSSQVLVNGIRQNQPQKIKSITKKWHQNTMKDLEEVCTKQDHNLL